MLAECSAHRMAGADASRGTVGNKNAISVLQLSPTPQTLATSACKHAKLRALSPGGCARFLHSSKTNEHADRVRGVSFSAAITCKGSTAFASMVRKASHGIGNVRQPAAQASD